MTLERLKRLNGEGFKHTFEPNPEAIIINRNQVIVDHLLEKCDKFTLLNNGHSELTILGEIGETGLIITDSKERIVAAVKHPNVTPSKLDSSIGLVEFGGETDTTHIEPMLEIPVGEERAAIHARLILNHLRNGESLE